jgi:hypothetical protein
LEQERLADGVHRRHHWLMSNPTGFGIRRSAPLAKLGFWFAMLLPSCCCAALQWDSLQVSETAWAGDKSAVATYRFRNTGTRPVTITSLQTSCGCTTAEIPKKVFLAGEVGTVKATMDLGNRFGPQTKLITVICDDAPAKPTELVLSVNIQSFATANPQFVYWKLGEKNSPKRILISANALQTIADVQARPVNPAFRARIVAVQPGKEYELWLAPESTDKSMNASIDWSVFAAGQLRPTTAVFAAVTK